MPLTQAQADDLYIINSLAKYLNAAVKVPYDTFVAGLTDPVTGWNTPLKIADGSPDDPDIALDPPKIAIDCIETSNKDADYGIGTNIRLRTFNFVLYCYPSLTNGGLPNKAAMIKLQSLLKNALSGVNIRVVDYGNAGYSPSNVIYTGEVMTLRRVSGPMPRGKQTSLPQERHRFDFHIHVDYPVFEAFSN